MRENFKREFFSFRLFCLDKRIIKSYIITNPDAFKIMIAYYLRLSFVFVKSILKYIIQMRTCYFPFTAKVNKIQYLKLIYT